MQSVEANGAKIPAVGLGTWLLNGSAGSRITEQALKLGYRHLHFALMYGKERAIGEGLRASGGKREEVFITTKVPHTELAPAALERAVKQSLANLRLSEVNLLLVHWPNPQIPLARTRGGDVQDEARPLPALQRHFELHRAADRAGGETLFRADRHQSDR